MADFVFRFLQSKQQYISSELRRGSAQPHVYASDLGKLEIPIPPMDEQRRIVAVLDKAFAGIAAATANAHKNLSDARALFESYLQSVFTERRHGLVFKPLSEVCDRKPSKSEARRRLTPVDEVSFVPMNQLGIHKRNFVASETRALTSVEGSYTYFANGDVLLAKITPCFENGKLGIARDLKNGVGFGSSEFMVLRPKTELLAEYLYYFLDRAHFRETGAKAMTGAVGHKRVPPEFVESLEIAVRPIGDQRQIVTVLDALSDDVIKLQSLYQRKLASLNELKQSLLQKAFAGELT